jgi:histidinol dehydrogenase
MSEEGIRSIGKECALLAKTEGLGAHEASVLERLK